jgi:hypothetical protein
VKPPQQRDNGRSSGGHQSHSLVAVASFLAVPFPLVSTTTAEIATTTQMNKRDVTMK